jgi:hypothetical protein
MAVAALRHPEHFAHVDSAREVGTAHARVMFAAILGGRCAGSSDGITKAHFIAWFVACVSCDQDWEQGEQSVGERGWEPSATIPPSSPPSGFAAMIESAAAAPRSPPPRWVPPSVPTPAAPLPPAPDARDPVQETALLHVLRTRFHGRGEDLETTTI